MPVARSTTPPTSRAARASRSSWSLAEAARAGSPSAAARPLGLRSSQLTASGRSVSQMTRRLTVWTRVEAKGVPAALALLRHLDAQTLPVEDWELVISTAPSALSAALEFAVSHRPNVRLVVGAEELVDPEGDWVLRLALDDRLEASALSRLVDIGGQSGGH